MSRPITFLFTPYQKFMFWERLFSPRFASVSVEVEGVVYMLDFERGPRHTTLEAFLRLFPECSQLPYDAPTHALNYYWDTLLGIDKWGVWHSRWVACRLRDGENCSTLASLIVGERFYAPDTLYDFLKGK